MGERVLVCGGRDFADREFFGRTMASLFPTPPFCIIHGGARGADTLAGQWAAHNRIHCETYYAAWNVHGKAAGAIRNQRMLDEGKPTLVVAFPGGRGTADMVRRARAAGVRVAEVDGSRRVDPLAHDPPSFAEMLRNGGRIEDFARINSGEADRDLLSRKRALNLIRARIASSAVMADEERIPVQRALGTLIRDFYRSEADQWAEPEPDPLPHARG